MCSYLSFCDNCLLDSEKYMSRSPSHARNKKKLIASAYGGKRTPSKKMGVNKRNLKRKRIQVSTSIPSKIDTSMDPEEFKAMLQQSYSNSKKMKPNTPLSAKSSNLTPKAATLPVDDALNLFEEDVSFVYFCCECIAGCSIITPHRLCVQIGEVSGILYYETHFVC